MRVLKRDNTVVSFNKEKIEIAILKAFEDLGIEDVDGLAIKIADEISNISKKEISVEEIQDIVEKKLMASKHKDVAKAYTNYRYLRQLARQQYDGLWKAIEEKLMAENVENQNANVDENSFGGRVGEASRVVTKKHALDYLVSPMAKANHENNEIYIHDLDSYSLGMHNCLSIPFDDLLKNGFKTRQTDVRPAGSINTAFQLVAVIFQLQSLQQFGGVSATHIDWTMVPYVRKSFFKHYKDGVKYIAKYPELDYSFHNDLSIDDLDYKAYSKEAYDYAMDMTQRELNQAIEGLYHNLNTLQSRSGNQLPFTSINYGTCTLPEGRMVTKALLNGSLAGVGEHHLTPIFPCGIFQCMKGINRKPDDPNYDLFKLALESTAKRLYPNYANVDWSGNAGYDINDPRTFFSTMGCRTANGMDINAEPEQNPQLKDGRGNICPVTIILPTLAMEAKQSITERDGVTKEAMEELIVNSFMKLLNMKIYEARDMLIERFEWICKQDPSSARFMYENGLMYGYKPEEGIRSALKHGTLAIGQLGLAEALQILIGCDHTEEKGMELAKRIEQLFNTRCTEFKKLCSLNFGVYFSPAENLCYTALKKFRDKYGVIENVSDKEFFTNSMHVPVWKKITATEKIDIESQLTGYSSAGCITYIELDGGAKNNIEALEQLVNYAMDKDVPYFAINVPNDSCMDCGYTDEFNDKCPECGSENIRQLRRVTGYLTGNYKTAFNAGKIDEVEHREKHSSLEQI